MKYKAILFDMDGVLINSEPLHYRVWCQVFKETYGIEIDYDVYKPCIGSSSPYLIQLMKDAYGVDLKENPGIFQDYKVARQTIIEKEGFPPVPGVQKLIPALKAKGYRLAVASSSPLYYIENAMESLGIKDCFEKLVSGEGMAHPKPAPDIFLVAADKLGVAPEDCLVVEDSKNGSMAAKAAGMTCYGFANPDSGDQDLSAADKLIHNFTELKELL